MAVSECAGDCGLDFVWELQDLLNQLMVLPNVLALVVLAGTVAEAAHRK